MTEDVIKDAPTGDFYVSDMPIGIRGWVFSLGRYYDDVSVPIKTLQKYLEVSETGEYDKETCAELENVIKYKGVVNVLSELSEHEQHKNGAKYINSQFVTPMKFIRKEDWEDMVSVFNKDNYGELIQWKKKS